jgi:hypothetical protein
MAELITGDKTKGIKSVGELALRISKFDSYRLFTLYENVKERKVMDVSGDQKYYLVFKSPKKEIRIPEYDPKGFFEVDKVNGCILFKITKKNAEDILSMKTAGEKIFHIIRVFEERDAFGKVLSVTDEVEVYNGKWGDDFAFSSFTTENKVDLLTKSLAAQVDKNATQLNEYKDLLEKYNSEVDKISSLEKELEAMRAERDSLQTSLNEYMGNTYDGTLLSTDTKYIAFENTLENISFTEEQLSAALVEAMGKDGFEMGNDDDDEPKIELDVKVYWDDMKDVKLTIYRNGITIGSISYDNNVGFNKFVDISHDDEFKFVCTGMTSEYSKVLTLSYSPNVGYEGFVNIGVSNALVTNKIEKSIVMGTVNYERDGEMAQPIGNIGKLTCYIE